MATTATTLSTPRTPIDWPYKGHPGILLVTKHPAADPIARFLRDEYMIPVAITTRLRVLWDRQAQWFSGADRLRNPVEHLLGEPAEEDHVEEVRRKLMATDKTVVVLGPGWTRGLALNPDNREQERSDVAMHVVGICGLMWLIDVKADEHKGPPGFGKLALTPEPETVARKLAELVIERLRGTRYKVPA